MGSKEEVPVGYKINEETEEVASEEALDGYNERPGGNDSCTQYAYFK